jgi:hypothetical protein
MKSYIYRYINIFEDKKMIFEQRLIVFVEKTRQTKTIQNFHIFRKNSFEKLFKSLTSFFIELNSRFKPSDNVLILEITIFTKLFFRIQL